MTAWGKQKKILPLLSEYSKYTSELQEIKEIPISEGITVCSAVKSSEYYYKLSDIGKASGIKEPEAKAWAEKLFGLPSLYISDKQYW